MPPVVHIAAVPTAPGHGSADAHTLLRSLYEEVTGQAAPALLLESRGKPYFASGPWHCSISHTRQLALCALAQCPVGLDAEPLCRKVRPGLPQKVLSPRELEAWRAAEDPSALFLCLWTLKEACVKYTGRGLEGYPANLSFQVDVPEARLEGSPLTFCLWRSFGHMIALCTPEPCACTLRLRPDLHAPA